MSWRRWFRRAGRSVGQGTHLQPPALPCAVRTRHHRDPDRTSRIRQNIRFALRGPGEPDKPLRPWGSTISEISGRTRLPEGSGSGRPFVRLWQASPGTCCLMSTFPLWTLEIVIFFVKDWVGMVRNAANANSISLEVYNAVFSPANMSGPWFLSLYWEASLLL